jgi:hypothetical protein
MARYIDLYENCDGKHMEVKREAGVADELGHVYGIVGLFVVANETQCQCTKCNALITPNQSKELAKHAGRCPGQVPDECCDTCGRRFDDIKHSNGLHISLCRNRRDGLVGALTTLDIVRKLNSNEYEIEKWISAGTLSHKGLGKIDKLNQANGKKLTKDELKRVKKDGVNHFSIIRKALGIASAQDKRNPVEGGEMGSLLTAAGFPGFPSRRES